MQTLNAAFRGPDCLVPLGGRSQRVSQRSFVQRHLFLRAVRPSATGDESGRPASHTRADLSLLRE